MKNQTNYRHWTLVIESILHKRIPGFMVIYNRYTKEIYIGDNLICYFSTWKETFNYLSILKIMTDIGR